MSMGASYNCNVLFKTCIIWVLYCCSSLGLGMIYCYFCYIPFNQLFSIHLIHYHGLSISGRNRVWVVGGWSRGGGCVLNGINPSLHFVILFQVFLFALQATWCIAGELHYKHNILSEGGYDYFMFNVIDNNGNELIAQTFYIDIHSKSGTKVWLRGYWGS